MLDSKPASQISHKSKGPRKTKSEKCVQVECFHVVFFLNLTVPNETKVQNDSCVAHTWHSSKTVKLYEQLVMTLVTSTGNKIKYLREEFVIILWQPRQVII